MSADIFNQGFHALETGAGFETPFRTITEDDVLAFAELTGDANPQHVDAEAALESGFGERVAHGMLVVSFALGMMPKAPVGVVLRSVRQAVFKRPVPLGTAIRVQAEVLDVKTISEQSGLVRMAVRVRDADDRLVVRMEVDSVWPR
jgi:acyl dehydratase